MPDVAVEQVPCPMCEKMQPAPEAFPFQCVVCKKYGFACCVTPQGNDGAVVCSWCRNYWPTELPGEHIEKEDHGETD